MVVHITFGPHKCNVSKSSCLPELISQAVKSPAEICDQLLVLRLEVFRLMTLPPPLPYKVTLMRSSLLD